MTAPDANRGPYRDAWRRLSKNRVALLGGTVVGFVAVCCFLLPALFGMDPDATHPAERYLPPGVAHLLGTDVLGRDYLARLLVGGRTSLTIGFSAALASVVVGVLYGAVSGYYGGRVDELLMRLVDFLYGIPYMFLVILVMLLFSEKSRGNPVPVFVSLGLVEWLTMARVVRGEVLSLREREFVLAARLSGASDARIVLSHLLPNVAGVVTVYGTLTVPSVIILESFLSFLGLGVKLSWGQLVAEGISVVNPVRSHAWLLVAPSVLLATTLVCLNFVGDGLRDALDPKAPR
ncbi:MAG TPA: ABC transporter permease [Polyangiaceae bacterium]|nr:ABC transporter permease [Polyangiaceae bacterium]